MMASETGNDAMTAPQVYAAIAEVQAEIAKVGIAKTRKNSQGSGYMFRGIDDVYETLGPLLPAKGLVVIPRIVERAQVERVSKSGGNLFYTTVKGEFDFVSVKDGSQHTASSYGEALDSGDKSTAKAMSAAYKSAAFMLFNIPVEGTPDADEETHEVKVHIEEPATGWGDWARDLIEEAGLAVDNESLDDLRDKNKRLINGVNKLDPFIFKAVQKAFTDRRSVLSAGEAF
jgi:hypothetical protein